MRMPLRPFAAALSPVALALIYVALLALAADADSRSDAGRPTEASKNSSEIVDEGGAIIRNQRQPLDDISDQQDLSTGLAGYLLAEATDKRLNLSDPIDMRLSEILNRKGPDFKPLRDFREFDDVTLEVAERAWRLMREHAVLAVTDRIKLTGPVIEQVIIAAKVSQQCINSARSTLQAANDFESWAIQLLSSWGTFPPTGVYEGTFGDIGSYHGCINVPENPAIGHAHYCSIAYRPVMPVRNDYELIVRKEEKLSRLFIDDINPGAAPKRRKTPKKKNSVDAFTDLLAHAQYSHYVYYKFGTCFPIGCSPADVQLIAHLLGRRSILLTGPVKCYSKFSQDYTTSKQNDKTHNNSSVAEPKQLQISTRDLNDGIYIWKPHMTTAQWVSFVIVALLIGSIVGLTIVDIFLYRKKDIFARVRPPPIKLVTEGAQNGNDNCNKTSNPAHSPVDFCAKSVQSDCEKNKDIARQAEDTNNNNSNNNYCARFTLSDEVVHEMNCIGMIEVDAFKTVPLNDDDDYGDDYDETDTTQTAASQPSCHKSSSLSGKQVKVHRSLFREFVRDCSLVTNIQQFFKISPSQLSNDILCINGIRCITMSWIIITHTMQYNDWSAFARILEVETHLKSLVNQPLFNGSYLVDSFFLISGLLTSFTSFKRRSGQEMLAKFSARSYLVGRYLRLTPQILFTSLLYILLPLMSSSASPHWYTMTGEYSENCARNWWINLFHIQAFYKTDEMCNFVCWWISVDMVYHLFALAIICLVVRLARPRLALESCITLALAHVGYEAMRHYQLKLPPNLLSTIPQTGAMWSQMTLNFFWQPHTHAFPFFLGFYVGYLMAQHHAQLANWFTRGRALAGWMVVLSLQLCLSYSTYFWVVGTWRYTRLGSTIFYTICPLVWAGCLSWIILACQYGYGGWANSVLSCRLFVVLGKASYIVYLSHFIVLFGFFGSQNLLLEPTQLLMLYVTMGNIFLSMLLGCVLCICFEMPWLKMQKRIMRYVR